MIAEKEPPQYHRIFTGTYSPKYTVCLNINGSVDTFYHESDGQTKLVSRFENKDRKSGIICGNLRPEHPTHPEETAIVGTICGRVEEIKCLDGRRVWNCQVSKTRVTEVNYSSTGRYLLTGDSEGRITIFDSESKKQLGDPIDTGSSEIFSLACLEEHGIIMCLSIDHQLSVWDQKTRQRIGQQMLISPMRTAHFLEGSQLVYSSFNKNSGICVIDLTKVNDSNKQETWKIADSYLRVQALRPLGKGTFGCIFEDNSAMLIDRLSGGCCEWQLPEGISDKGKIMDFCLESRTKTIKFCVGGDVVCWTGDLPEIPKGMGVRKIEERTPAEPIFNLRFESLESLTYSTEDLPQIDQTDQSVSSHK